MLLSFIKYPLSKPIIYLTVLQFWHKMSPNELSNALKCFFELTVKDPAAKTTYEQGLDFVRSYCYGGPTGNMRTFLENWRINHYFNAKFFAIWRQEKEERKSRTSCHLTSNWIYFTETLTEAVPTREERSNRLVMTVMFASYTSYFYKYLFSCFYHCINGY